VKDKNISEIALSVFNQSINDYHFLDNINQTIKNPYSSETLEHLLYTKNWIDTIQWHYEDLIRDPDIDPESGMRLKRKIDASNQERTDMVEFIDSFFLDKYKNVKPMQGAQINSESPAWAIDRLSILALKIYHMDEEANRENASDEHRKSCEMKLKVLMEQRSDLSNAIDLLLHQISEGRKYMKVYKQMKMYNDDELNPVLYKDRNK
tara:strand:- start:18789 stop:19409 length:621 start_codon:yes stop_codon:yes gene_type:complete